MSKTKKKHIADKPVYQEYGLGMKNKSQTDFK